MPPSQRSPQYRQAKFHEAISQPSPQEPVVGRVSEKSAAPQATKTANTASKGPSIVVHDKVWLYTFLLHTIAYLGVSGYVNYTTITNDKQPITEDSEFGPIDM